MTNPNWNFPLLNNFFNERLGLNEIEIILTMGAHTLGRGHKTLSRQNVFLGGNPNLCCGGAGYHGKWKMNATAFNRGYSIFKIYMKYYGNKEKQIVVLIMRH